MKRLLLLAVLFVALLAACGEAPVVVPLTPTPTPTPTATPITQVAAMSPSPTVPTPTPSPAVAPTPTPSPTALSPVQFAVLSVDLAVSPATRTGIVCGATETFTYTATFHVVGSGQAQFNYTTTNGRQISMGSLNFMDGSTVEAFTFTATGPVTLDNTFPGTAGVFVVLPNEVRSPVIILPGTCTPGN